MSSTCNNNILEWYITWGGFFNEYGIGMELDRTGNIFITGATDSYINVNYSLDVILLKYDSDGNLLWNKTWGGKNVDYGMGIALEGSGNIFITGGTEDYIAGNRDVILLKYDSDGNLLWNKTCGGKKLDDGCAIALDGSGNVFIVGGTDSYGAGFFDLFILKYNSDGNLLWNKTWGSNSQDYGYEIVLDDLGNAFITGYAGSYGLGENNIFLSKYDTDGNLLWNKTWGGENWDYGRAITLDGSGNIFITGGTDHYGAGALDVILLKYDSDGILLLNKTWGGYSHDYGMGITLDDSGNIFITGATDSYGKDYYDSFLIKYYVEGNLQWYKIWGGLYDDSGMEISLDERGNAFITGSTVSYPMQGTTMPDYPTSFLPSYTDLFLLKYGIDTDLDGLSDDEEVNKYYTDPNDSDTDGDGQNDGDEIAKGFDPNNPFSNLFSFILIIIILIGIISIISLVILIKIKKKRTFQA